MLRDVIGLVLAKPVLLIVTTCPVLIVTAPYVALPEVCPGQPCVVVGVTQFVPSKRCQVANVVQLHVVAER